MSKRNLASCIWQELGVEGQPPCARQGHAIAAIDEIVYMFGGSSATEDGQKFKFHNDLYALHVDTETVRWRKVAQIGKVPAPRDGHSMCAVGKKIYLYGGKSHQLAKQCLPGLFVLDTEQEQLVWEEVATTGSAPLTLGHTLSHVGSTLYVIGGLCDSVASNDVWMLHLDLHTWVPLKVSGLKPSPRCDHAAAVVESRIYVFGGCGAEDIYYNDVFILDTASLVWEMPKIRGTPPQARAGHTFTAHRTKDIYVFGGTIDCLKHDMPIYSDVVKLSLSKLRWKWPLFTGKCAEGRYNHAAVTIHSQLYIIGGLGRSGQFNNVRALRLINPSDRKLAVEPILAPREDAGYQPTLTPHLNYDVKGLDSSVSLQFTQESVKDNDGDNEKDRSITPIQVTKHIQNLKTQTVVAIEKALMELSDQYENLFRREQQLRDSQERLREEREVFERIHSDQKTEITELVKRHREQTENWLLLRKAENDEERRKISKQKEALEVERRTVELERADLKERAEQLRRLARQMSHTNKN